MTKTPAKKTARKKTAPKKAAKKMPKTPQVMALEMMRVLTDTLGPNDLIMPEDVDALLTSLRGPFATDGLSDEEADARDEAQQIAFDAMEAESEAEARKLAKRALKLYPDCVDALVVMAGIESDSPRKMIEGLQNAAAAGERSLGAKFIRENKGHFWGLIETRPYMRALEQLASLLRAEGFKLDATKYYEKILALNPNDNQGVRDPLLGLYLATGNLEAARRLLKDYEQDASANFAWGRVLERFLSRDLPRAAAELKIARKGNRFVELYLSGRKGLPKEMPEMYSPGSDEEAVLVLDSMSLAWAEHKEALLWLMEQLMSRPAQKPTRAKTGMRLQ
jgi:tetratricopeptide (TPR) repeat protein